MKTLINILCSALVSNVSTITKYAISNLRLE